MVEPLELFEKLESNDTEVVENARAEIYILFQNVRDSWLINGLYDYYLNSNSLRSMEILTNVNEPHHKYLFERLTESIKRQETEIKVKALTLLGHIVRKQPTWIYKIHDHPLMREVLLLLKNEDDIVALISALLLVIILMPMIPSLIAHHLPEIFDVFSRLAAWNLGTGAIADKQLMIHMQISLYALFLRLYGMYPCNFIAYLRSFYRDRYNPVFVHTIQPMLETVRMHPRLVTASKDNEISAERWKTLCPQQVIAECEQFYVDVVDKCPHDCCYVSTGFRSRSGTSTSAAEPPKYNLGELKDLCLLPPQESKRFFTPSFAFPELALPPTAPTRIVQPHYFASGGAEGTSPPEAAIEATPETTPDTRTSANIRPPIIGSSVVRGLTSFTKNRSANTTPNQSQPSSPMRKDVSPFHFPSSSMGKRDSITNQKLQKLLFDRSQSMEAYIEPGVIPLNVPSSPVRILAISDTSRRNESPSTVEDDEVKAIVAGSKELVPTSPRKCDSVLHEDINVDNTLEDTLEQGSPCSQGGLHMPNSRSMNDFAKRVQRLRCHSQNYDKDDRSTGSSPGKESSGDRLKGSDVVRRVQSLPEIKKKSPIAAKANRPLNETGEDETNEENGKNFSEIVKKDVIHRHTQTEDSYMPYEHLFLNIFPCLGTSEVKSSPSPNPTPLKPFGEKDGQHSGYNVLDKHMETAQGDYSNPTVHIQLLQQQLLFERYRRETFATRNRNLQADAKNAKTLEEHNSALKDRIQLQQKDIESMKENLLKIESENHEKEKKHLRYKKYLEDKITDLQDQILKLEYERKEDKHNLDALQSIYKITDKERQEACNSLFTAYKEMNIAKEQAEMGEKARLEVERLNKEILLMGELQQKFEERLREAEQAKHVQIETEMLELSYREEVKALKSRADSSRSIMEAYRQRVIDLEGTLSQKDEGIALLKKQLIEVNGENYEKLRAVESKYQSQLAIIRGLEQKMLQLYTKIDFPALRNLHSPETSSCQEAIGTASVSGLSPHSSPLSVSLASSESSTAFLSSDIREMKNLQIIIDKRAGKLEDSIESAGDTIEMLQQPSTSGMDQTPTSGSHSQQQND